ncbi:UNVERIFIED_CONTAM: hypothetical protein GTU68_009776 [Idotea baltica]|nr:hypothetical protein [Idotea baltica]
MKDTKHNWCYQTEPEVGMHNRKMSWPRGRVLGGTSSINGMVYIRGQKEDYDHWEAQGNKGWSYDDLLPYFKRSEHKAEGASTYHGYGGPLWVENVKNEDKLELADLFLEAAVQAGIPYNEDFNGASQEGAGFYQHNIKNGVRQSTARTYLKLCENRPNLTIVTGALSRKIIIDDGTAVGVEYSETKGKTTTVKQAYARQEVILCAGVINSPQLLELSGIGDKDRLEALDIELQKDLPGVGENLQDHLTINVLQGLHGVTTFYEETRPHMLVKNIFKYLFGKRGLLTHPAAQVGLFFRTSEEQSRPMAQVHFAPAASEADSKGNLKTAPGTTATVCQLRPESRGSVHINSTDPEKHPNIKANYLATESDKNTMIAALRKVRDVFDAPALDRYRGEEFKPGRGSQSDEDLLAYIRAEAESVYHPVGTCKMGKDKTSVVNDRLQVKGIKSLRVADASIMPTIISGNTNATAIVIAEKCADMVLHDAKMRTTK